MFQHLSDFIGRLPRVSEGFYVSDGVLTHYEPPKPKAEITIPDEVREIAPKLFMNNGNLTKVTLPYGLTKIGASAFSGCIGLREIEIPATVMEIGENAFTMCRRLEKVTLPAQLQKLGRQSFRWCYALKEITIPPDITRLADGMFERCTSLTKVTLPENLTAIESQCFASCPALRQMRLPGSLSSIEAWAFNGCTGMEVFNIPASVTEIASGVFAAGSVLRFEQADGSFRVQLEEPWNEKDGKPFLNFLYTRNRLHIEPGIPVLQSEHLRAALLVYLMQAGRSDVAFREQMRQSAFSMAAYLLKENEIGGMARFLEEVCLTSDETDRLLGMAIDLGRLEMQIQLQDWKERQGYYTPPEKRLTL